MLRINLEKHDNNFATMAAERPLMPRIATGVSVPGSRFLIVPEQTQLAYRLMAIKNTAGIQRRKLNPSRVEQQARSFLV